MGGPRGTLGWYTSTVPFGVRRGRGSNGRGVQGGEEEGGHRGRVRKRKVKTTRYRGKFTTTRTRNSLQAKSLLAVYPESMEDVVKILQIANRHKMPIKAYHSQDRVSLVVSDHLIAIFRCDGS
ncbi:hypothetical protein B0H12DRAFT_1091584 [Mycena haematopus]|nr:hypothetical protein B0H12DRAFT_1091584 [Mycena haematopus]